MGRRYRRDYDDDDDGHAGEILTLAWERPVGGFIVSIFILLNRAGGSRPFLLTDDTPANSVIIKIGCPLFAYLLWIVGGMGLVVSAIGFVRD